MKRLILICAFCCGLLISTATADNIHTLIINGDLQQARDSLSRRASAASRDGNTMFYQSLVEPNAEEAVRLMETALQTSVQSRYQEEIFYRLAQYYFLKKQYSRLSQLLVDYRARWEDGRYQTAMARFSVLADERAGELESAVRQCDRYLIENSSGEAQQWGQIDKARLLKAHGKRIGSNQMLRQLSRKKDGEGIPQALYMLGMEAIERNRADDAIFYYNILREGYPASVGLDAMLTGLGEMSTGFASGNKAEQVTGTFYSVKVGVFSESGNARRQADKFRGQNRVVDIKTKKISGKNYRVVYVGRFDNYEEAVRFRLQLEASHNEAFQVVAR